MRLKVQLQCLINLFTNRHTENIQLFPPQLVTQGYEFIPIKATLHIYSGLSFFAIISTGNDPKGTDGSTLSKRSPSQPTSSSEL